MMYAATILGTAVVFIALIATAVLSIFAALRPNRVVSWITGGLLVGTILAAAQLPDAVAPQFAAIVALLGLVISVFGGTTAATTALDLAMGASAAPGLHGGIMVEPKADAATGVGVRAGAPSARREVLRGGLTIGVLERIAATGSMIAGFPEGLAIVVAVKGVGRFTELEAPEARERFIIGTLASLIWAAAAGLVVHLITT